MGKVIDLLLKPEPYQLVSESGQKMVMPALLDLSVQQIFILNSLSFNAIEGREWEFETMEGKPLGSTMALDLVCPKLLLPQPYSQSTLFQCLTLSTISRNTINSSFAWANWGWWSRWKKTQSCWQCSTLPPSICPNARRSRNLEIFCP